MKKIMIIGAGPGLAWEVEKRFGREGWHIVMVARNAERLENDVKRLKAQGIDATAHPLDVTNVVALDALVRKEAEEGLDVLNYNATPHRAGTLLQFPLESFVNDVMIGYGSAAVAARAAIPAMKARGSGTLIFSGGNTGVNPWYLRPIGGANKAAVRNLAFGLTRAPDCKGLRIVYVNIDAQVSDVGVEPTQLGVECAEVYWNLHNDKDPPASWEVNFSDGGDHSYLNPPNA